MKTKELKQALRLLTKVLTDPRVRPDQGERLQKAKRELDTVGRSGTVDAKKVFLAVEIIATVLQEIVEQQAA